MKHMIKVDLYRIVSDAVATGIEFGLNRAFKHTHEPSPEMLADALDTAIMGQLCEILRFDDDEEA